MSKVEFKFKNNIITILCYQEELMESICKKFAGKIHNDISNLIFLYGGNIIDPKLRFSQVINKLDKENKTMIVLVDEIDSENINSNSGIIKSIFPICPECSEKAILKVDNFKANIFGCKNGHINNNIIFNELEDTQKIEMAKIKCGECNISMKDTYDNEIYKCNKCKMFLCPLHKQNHEEGHRIIKYEEINYTCDIHDEMYVSYCKTCNTNICLKCEKAHKKHHIISFGSILPEKEELINILVQYKSIISTFNNNINGIINKLINIRDNVDVLYKTYSDMVIHYNDNHRNFEVFTSLDNIKDNIIFKALESINHVNGIGEQLEKTLNLYEKFNFYDKMEDEINIIYNIDKKEKIKIFGEKFVKNNKDICKIIYDKKEYDLTEYFEINQKLDKLNIKLKGINNIKNSECMFSDCILLESLPDISKWNTSNVTNMNRMFKGCNSLISFPDISKWDTSNVNNMEHMFSECKSLESLPEISNWNTNQVNTMSFMFYGCSSLKSLPDISKWNISNVKDLSTMFSECSSLKVFPDLSKWNTSNVNNMKNMFRNCKLLETLPNLAIWNTSNVENMDGMFFGCEKLVSLPDISIWDLKNVITLKYMFSKCSSLTLMPDLSRWNLSKVVDISYLFYGCTSIKKLSNIGKWNISNVKIIQCLFYECKSLKELPDLSKWNTSKITIMNSAFYKCSSLKSLPDISKWNTESVEDMSFLFSGCSSLISLPDISKWNTTKVTKKKNMFTNCPKTLVIPQKFQN